MILTVQQVFDATPILAKIKDENRPLPSKGKYRIARMHRKMEAEWNTIAERYNAMIKVYGHQRPTINGKVVTAEEAEGAANVVMQDAVPDEKWQEFLAAWKDIAAEEIEVAVEPIPLDQLCIGGEEGGISIAEFSVLDVLVEG